MNKSLFIVGLMLVALTACGEKKVEEMAPAADQAAPAAEQAAPAADQAAQDENMATPAGEPMSDEAASGAPATDAPAK